MTLLGMHLDLAGALLIFCLRLADVTLGTVRTVLVMRGVRFVAALVGFFEIIIWVVAISRVMAHLDNVFIIIAYAGGYSCCILIGIFVEERLAGYSRPIDAVCLVGNRPRRRNHELHSPSGWRGMRRCPASPPCDRLDLACSRRYPRAHPCFRRAHRRRERTHRPRGSARHSGWCCLR